MNKSTDETAAMDRHDEPYKSQLQRIGQAIGYGRAQPAAPADAAPSVAPEPVAWEGGEGWESLAWELCADENGEDACNELICEGGA